MAAAGKYLWMRETDSLDVQRLVRYTISLGESRSGMWGSSGQ